MKARFFWLIVALLMPVGARAHIGSSDVFFDGKVGEWPTHITIRMPSVVPGRAEIIAQVQSVEPVTVSYTPIAARTAIRNAPPAEAGGAGARRNEYFHGRPLADDLRRV